MKKSSLQQTVDSLHTLVLLVFKGNSNIWGKIKVSKEINPSLVILCTCSWADPEFLCSVCLLLEMSSKVVPEHNSGSVVCLTVMSLNVLITVIFGCHSNNTEVSLEDNSSLDVFLEVNMKLL